MSLRWKPIRKGRIYCSPACGANCTHAEYMKAHKLADKLIKKCQKEVGGKWIKHVHENLGWHYCVNLKDAGLTINPNYMAAQNGETYYTVSTGSATPIQVSVNCSGKNIKKLVQEQISAIKAEADRWNLKLNLINKALKLKQAEQK